MQPGRIGRKAPHRCSAREWVRIILDRLTVINESRIKFLPEVIANPRRRRPRLPPGELVDLHVFVRRNRRRILVLADARGTAPLVVARQPVDSILRDRPGSPLLPGQPLAEGGGIFPADLPGRIVRSFIPAFLALARLLAHPLAPGRLDKSTVIAPPGLPDRELHGPAAGRGISRAAGDLHRHETHAQRVLVGTLRGDRNRGPSCSSR